MKIAITATGPDLNANVDPFFGRCQYFLIVETDDLTHQAIKNPNLALGSGAGIQSAQLLAKQGVRQVLTGNCGPKAYQTLAAAGLAVSIGCSGTIREAIDQFKAGRRPAAEQPNVVGHFGMGAAQADSLGQATGPGAGLGAGLGRGMGCGLGRGMGRGMAGSQRGGAAS